MKSKTKVNKQNCKRLSLLLKYHEEFLKQDFGKC